MRNRFSRLFGFYNNLLHRHKYPVQIATGGFLWFSGDLLCQSIVSKDTTTKFDWNRTFKMSLYGVCISAPTYAFWYTFLDRLSLSIFLNTSSLLKTWKIVSFKLFMDSIVFDPLYLSLFFIANSRMDGKSWLEIREKLKKDLTNTWIVDLLVWTPIQTANFRFIPVSYQPLVVQSCNIAWNAYLSYVQHEK